MGQKYIHQYAGNYMGDKNATMLKSKHTTGASGGQDYQQYMHQYAGKYMGGQNTTGASGGQDYQQYMHQYADKYTGAGGYKKYMKQNSGHNSSGAGPVALSSDAQHTDKTAPEAVGLVALCALSGLALFVGSLVLHRRRRQEPDALYEPLLL